jgi:hypothetical protein
MISVHHNLEATRRLDSLTVHGLPDYIHVGGATLDDGLRPHPEADEGGFHRVICSFVSLLIEVRPHFDERFVFCRTDRLEVTPGRQVPDGENDRVEQFAFADGESLKLGWAISEPVESKIKTIPCSPGRCAWTKSLKVSSLRSAARTPGTLPRKGALTVITGAVGECAGDQFKCGRFK